MKAPGIYGLMVLPEFQGGALKVSIGDLTFESSVAVTAEGPGFVATSTGVLSPKDWSPLGLLPKGWIQLFEYDGHGMVIKVRATYTANDREFTVDMMLGAPPNKKSNVYFVPAVFMMVT